MGSCLSAPAVPPPSSCSPREKDLYEWRIGLQEHRISQLRMRLRQWEAENAGIQQGSRDLNVAPGKTALSGIAERYGQASAIRDTRQVLRDLAILNYYQRCALDNLACAPERCVPRVRFE